MMPMSEKTANNIGQSFLERYRYRLDQNEEYFYKLDLFTHFGGYILSMQHPYFANCIM